MTKGQWKLLARSVDVQTRIRSDLYQEDFRDVVSSVERKMNIDWVDAVALLHMVYAWMPTMLRPISEHDDEAKERLLETLSCAKSGDVLGYAGLERVTKFANRSIVGASKLLHVLCPSRYPVWDSRVADVFLWPGVSRACFAKVDRYIQYVDALRAWEQDTEVRHICEALRKLNPNLTDAPDLRMIELVLYRAKK